MATHILKKQRQEGFQGCRGNICFTSNLLHEQVLWSAWASSLHLYCSGQREIKLGANMYEYCPGKSKHTQRT